MTKIRLFLNTKIFVFRFHFIISINRSFEYFSFPSELKNTENGIMEYKINTIEGSSKLDPEISSNKALKNSKISKRKVIYFF